MKSKKQQIIQYSALAITFIALHEKSNAQVIYTDINPDDTVLNDVAGGLAYIDMDNDGVVDFAFLNNTFTYLTMPYDSSIITYERIWAGPAIMQNSIAGMMQVITFSSTSSIRYMPDALNSGELINEDIPFQNWGFQSMAYRTFSYSILLSDPVTSSGGFWFPERISKYLGVSFRDDADSSHFGWIRCSVLDSGRTLILHDYAYEVQVNYPILAGDTISYVSIEEGENSELVTAYTLDNTLYVVLKEIQENAEAVIYDMQGKRCYRKELTMQTNSIRLKELPAGLYILNIQFNNTSFSKKIIVSK
ncbi:MAG: T9SS type A sorting domain-containing protein [Chitinophagales bacterium]